MRAACHRLLLNLSLKVINVDYILCSNIFSQLYLIENESAIVSKFYQGGPVRMHGYQLV